MARRKPLPEKKVAKKKSPQKKETFYVTKILVDGGVYLEKRPDLDKVIEVLTDFRKKHQDKDIKVRSHAGKIRYLDVMIPLTKEERKEIKAKEIAQEEAEIKYHEDELAAAKERLEEIKKG